VKVFNPRKFEYGESLQPDAYLNPEFQSAFGVVNGQIDSRNIQEENLSVDVCEARAWLYADQIIFEDLLDIFFPEADGTFASFNCITTINTPEGFMTGSISLVYAFDSVSSDLTNGDAANYNDTRLKTLPVHRFALFLDGMIIGETDNIGSQEWTSCHIPFSTPIESGEHVLELKVQLPAGSAAPIPEFVPINYAYAWYQVRRR